MTQSPLTLQKRIESRLQLLSDVRSLPCQTRPNEKCPETGQLQVMNMTL